MGRVNRVDKQASCTYPQQHLTHVLGQAFVEHLPATDPVRAEVIGGKIRFGCTLVSKQQRLDHFQGRRGPKINRGDVAGEVVAAQGDCGELGVLGLAKVHAHCDWFARVHEDLGVDVEGREDDGHDDDGAPHQLPLQAGPGVEDRSQSLHGHRLREGLALELVIPDDVCP